LPISTVQGHNNAYVFVRAAAIKYDREATTCWTARKSYDAETRALMVEGANFLGVAAYGSVLYYRPVYHEIRDIMEGIAEHPDKLSRSILTGTPGIGKSMLDRK